MSAYSATQIARKNGYRSGLEDAVAEYLKYHKIKFLYEKIKIEWEDLAYRTYTHLCIKKQHPDLDIRFVFTNSKRKLRKGAKSSYAEWCIKYEFRYYDRIIPEDWLKEKGKNKHSKFIKFKQQKIKRR